MASNPYLSRSRGKANVKVQNHDWSHSYNFSTNIGRVQPVFCDIVPPHTSVSVNPHLGLQFMPLAFPIQTPLRARVSFFKVPLRALWEGYEDFISVPSSTTLEEPYVGITNAMDEEKFRRYFGTGSLADAFNVPTTYDTEDVYFSQDEGSIKFPNPNTIMESYFVSSTLQPSNAFEYSKFLEKKPGAIVYNTSGIAPEYPKNGTVAITSVINIGDLTPATIPSDRLFSISGYVTTTSGLFGPAIKAALRDSKCCLMAVYGDGAAEAIQLTDAVDVKFPTIPQVNDNALEFFVEGLHVNQTLSKGSLQLVFFAPNYTDGYKVLDRFRVSFEHLNIYGESTYSKSCCPWYNSDTKKGIKLSAYPFRAYHAIYNAYLRNSRNNPLLDVDGKPVYNRWVLNRRAGGSDLESAPASGMSLDEYFGFRYANWELDQFTSCVKQPQQYLDPENPDRAPLVGITDYAVKVKSVDEKGVAMERSVLKSYLTNPDGESYEISYTQNDRDKVLEVGFTRADLPDNSQRIVDRFDAVTSGIRIEDFRNVNALQLYLERNNFSEFTYKSITEGRYNVKLSYDSLLMPEFCGGFTRDVNISTVMQTVDDQQGDGTYVGALGSRAGDAICRGNGSNIKIFCEEESVVMGLLIISPQPVYTQHLPRMFSRRGLFDRYAPEFANIGMQPVRYQDVAPIQTFMNFNDLPDKPKDGYSALTKTFGYQVAWWEYFNQVDTAHGLFRGPLRNFLMSRVFSGVPQLGKRFTIVNPDDVDNVFSVTEFGDKVIGSVYFDMTVKNIVSDFSVPRLE